MTEPKKYIQKIRIPEAVMQVEHTIALCLDCNSNDINISEYEDMYGFISTAKCNSCGRKISRQETEAGIIKEWNNQNDLDTLIINKTKQIKDLRTEISKIKLQKKYRKNGRK